MGRGVIGERGRERGVSGEVRVGQKRGVKVGREREGCVWGEREGCESGGERESGVREREGCERRVRERGL